MCLVVLEIITQLSVIAFTSAFYVKSRCNWEVNISFGVDTACLTILGVAYVRDELELWVSCKAVEWGLQTRAGQTNLDATMECVWRTARCAMVTQSAGTGVMSHTAMMGVRLAQTNSIAKWNVSQFYVECWRKCVGIIKCVWKKWGGGGGMSFKLMLKD